MLALLSITKVLNTFAAPNSPHHDGNNIDYKHFMSTNSITIMGKVKFLLPLFVGFAAAAFAQDAPANAQVVQVL